MDRAADARLAGAARAQTPDPADIADGMRLFQQKGNCQACHGWAGDGRKMDSQMPDGANLRETKLDRETLIMTIKCGLPGHRHAGLRPARLQRRALLRHEAGRPEARAASTMPDPPATLQPREIELIADFLFAKVVGKGPMDRAKCVEFWGSDVDACNELPK